MDLAVSLEDRGDRASAIYRALVAAMSDGRLRSGDRLPATRSLAADLGVSRTTVASAYERLVSEGYVEGRVGAGTYVTEAGTPRTPAKQADPGALRPRPGWTYTAEPTSSSHADIAFDFRTGIPDPTLFPFDTWRRLVTSELRLRANSLGAYGDPSGHRPLREAIARHVGRARSVLTHADDVIITNGTQHALDLVGRVLISPNDLVAVEDPGYPMARELFQSHGARIAPVPVDDEGLVVSALPHGTRLVFTTPSHQFPMGRAMSLARRRELLEWCDSRGAAIFEDDYDSEFRFTERPLEPLYSLDTSGRVLYAGTFSKSLLPSLRMGFLLVPPSLRDAVQGARQLTDWHGVIPLQAALARFIDEGQHARHVRRASAIYARRHEAVVDGIERRLGEWLTVVPSSAGLHVCAPVRSGLQLDATGLVSAARSAGVVFETLSAFTIGPQALDGLVLGYGMAPAEVIDQGLARIAGLLGRYVTAA